MFLKDRDWSFPLEDLDRKFDEHYDVTAEKFHMARSDFLREWRFLEILWRRLQNDLRSFYESWSQLKKGTKEDSWEHNLAQVQYNFRISRRMMDSLDCIHLDTNCFLVNARILMDGVARLTTFLWRKIAKQQPKWRSFREHKKWFEDFNNKSKIIDKDYAQYIIQHTGWFKKLKNIRDKLIVHRFRSRDSYYVDAFKEASGTAIKGQAVYTYRDGEVVVEYDMNPVLDLNELMDDICDFLNFFDKHFSQML